MRCESCRELISAELDGEATDDERVRMEAHQASCASCAAYAADAGRLHRSMRIAPAAPVPDLTEAILERVPAPDHGRTARPRRARHARWAGAPVVALQYGLLVVALTIAVLAIPELIASSSASVHASRHLGGWDLAFAVGLVLAALQPWRARGLIPMAAVLGGVMVITAAIDIAHGSTPQLAEASHLLELFGLLFLWLLSRTAPGQLRDGRATNPSWREVAGSLRAFGPSHGRSLASQTASGPTPAPTASLEMGTETRPEAAVVAERRAA